MSDCRWHPTFHDPDRYRMFHPQAWENPIAGGWYIHHARHGMRARPDGTPFATEAEAKAECDRRERLIAEYER